MTDATPQASVPHFRKSASTQKIDLAIAKAQSKFGSVQVNAENPHFEKKYANLAAFWDAVRAPLAENQIAITQWPIHSTDGRLRVLTRVTHADEWYEAEFSLPLTKTDPQGYGATLTYLKRQVLGAVLGVAANDEDDDGNSVQGSANGNRPKNVKHREPIQPNHPNPKITLPPNQDAPFPVGQAPAADSRRNEPKSDPKVTAVQKAAHTSNWAVPQVQAYIAERFGDVKVSAMSDENVNELIATIRTKDYLTATKDLLDFRKKSGFISEGA